VASRDQSESAAIAVWAKADPPLAETLREPGVFLTIACCLMTIESPYPPSSASTAESSGQSDSPSLD
jgi:hypothetical protein